MRKTLRIILGVLVLLSALIAAVLLAFAVQIFLHFDGTYTGEEGSRGRGVACGLVFGAAVHRNSLPGPGITRRVGTAAELYKEGVLQHIIVTGGKGDVDTESEAAVMRTEAIADGIPAKDITVEDRARSTWENLEFSRPLTASCSTIIGISDRYHLARIEYLAHLQGFRGLQTLPAEPSAQWTFELKSLSREVAALLYYHFLEIMMVGTQK